MRQYVSALALALLLVVAGCSAPGLSDGQATTVDSTTEATTDAPTTQSTDSPTSTATPTATTAEPETTTAGDGDEAALADPESDRLGWEAGMWYNESLDVDPSDGYSTAEIHQVKNRMMARIEVVRQLEFQRNVSVEVVSRAEYRNQSTFTFPPSEWREQYLEATFIVDEPSSTVDAYGALYGSSVAGYYSPGERAIVLVAPGGEASSLPRSTLVHELVHALQDDALPRSPRAPNRDASTAATAVSEGDANYVMDRYGERCGAAWSCIDEPERESSAGDSSINLGLYASVWLPYSDGPTFVGALKERGGWAAVNDAYRSPPVSTEQVIHPETYPDETPTAVSIPDRSSRDWERLSPRYGSATGRFGEARLFAMLWANGVIDRDHVDTDPTRWNYSHPATAGWDGDAFVPYTDGDGYGYVFTSTWDSERDATEFHDAYLALLESKNATEVRDGVYRIPDANGFGDAFRVTKTGSTVVVVNAPTVDDLDDVHAAN
jgi:hypothetical protein